MLITPMPIILASASPRRSELLTQLGVRFEVKVADIDETYHQEEPKAYALRLARQKAEAVYKDAGGLLILAADTIVVCDGQVMGKPSSLYDFMEMITKLSNKTHQVYTAIHILHDKFAKGVCVKSNVTFKEISPSEAQLYWETGEPLDKAGGYGIQGLGAIFVQHIEGSYTNIVGLPLFEVHQLLQEAEKAIF